MTGDLITVGAVAAAVASALVAGIMFAFSTSVMPALGRRPAPEGIAAMQAMNSAILNPAFGLAFGGAALLCAALAITAPFTVDEPHALLRGVGAALYVVGTFGVTMAINVPMNVELDAADAAAPESTAVWRRYLRRWTAWNTLRTILGAAASALLVISLV
ncbi:MAG: DUF1772 domain-containing protein [Acidimicrobiales bacterium]